MQQHIAPIQLKPRKRDRGEEGVDDWLMTFADAVTLLMAFFVILFTLSEPNPEKFVKLSEQLKLEGFNKVEVENENKQLKAELQLMLQDSGFDQFATINETPEFISLELASTSFFEPGSARFSKGALPVLEKFAATLKKFEKSNANIVIEGHTDDSPISTPQFPSNWELSAGRAANLVRFLIAKGTPADKLSVAAFGDTRPKAVNRDATGNPILANQELNRRVVIKLVKRM